MDQNSTPPEGTPEQPWGRPPEEQSGQPTEPYSPPPGYVPPAQGYPPQQYPPGGYTPQYPAQGSGPGPGGYQPQYPPQYPPQGAPPPNYQQGFTPPPPGYPPAQPAPRTGWPAWAWIILIGGGLLVLCCVVAGIYFAIFASQASKTFSQIGTSIGEGLMPIGVSSAFYGEMNSSNYEGARAYLSPQMASQNSAADLESRWKALEDSAGTVTPGLPEATHVSGNDATVTQTFTGSNGNKYTVRLTLRKGGSDPLGWEITGASPGLVPSP